MSSYPEEFRARRPSGDAPLSPVALEARRQLALDRLTEAFASDLITMDGYEGRVSRVQGADGPEAIDEAVSDLPQVSPRAGKSAPERSSRRKSPELYSNAVDSRLRGEESVSCIMGNRVLSGDWLSGDKVGVFTLMGSTKIDLMDTALPPGRLRIDAFCLMGDIKVVVPRGLPVKMNGLPIMGNAHVAREVERHIERGSPYVEVSGLTLMGNIVIVTGN